MDSLCPPLLVRLKAKTTTMMRNQLELSFEKTTICRQIRTGRQRRMRGARWWFDQMRHVVDLALDRHAPRSVPPEQVYFSLGEQIRSN